MKRFTKFVAANLAFLLLSSTWLTPLAEANIWKERRQQNTRTVQQMAALPTTLLPQWNVPIEKTSFIQKVPDLNKFPKSNNKKATSALAAIASQISPSLGTIKKIHPATNGSNNKTVVLLEDVHMNQEAQNNISKLTGQLLTNHSIDAIAVEGAFESLNLIAYQTYADQPAIHRIADYFLLNNKISGPIHAAMTNTSKALIYGIDDRFHYGQNIEAYLASRSLTDSARKELVRQQMDIQKNKNIIFSKRLLEFDRQIELYRNQKISLHSYIQTLTNYSGESTNQIDLFTEAIVIENKMNFSQVELERNQILSQLIDKLSPKEISDLTEKTVAFRMGHVSNVALFAYLKALCEKSGIQISSFNQFNSYLQYLQLSDLIDGEKLFTDLQSLEKKAYSRLIQSAQDQKLVDQDRLVHLSLKLVEFSLTKEEWVDYKTTLNNGPHHDNSLSSFEKFYVEAEARDQKMASNISTMLRTHGTALVVAGGFHSKGLMNQLSKNGINTILVTPKLSHVTDQSGSTYLTAFAQEKSSLDKLLQGDKLFMARPPVQMTPAGAAPLFIADAEAGNPHQPLSRLDIQAIQSHFSATGEMTSQDNGIGHSVVTIPGGRIQYKASSANPDRKILSVRVTQATGSVLNRIKTVLLAWWNTFRSSTIWGQSLLTSSPALLLINPTGSLQLSNSSGLFIGVLLAITAFVIQRFASMGNEQDPEPMPTVIWPEEVGSTDVRIAGGKGINLNIMARNGDPGKINVIVTPAAYDRHIEGNQVDYNGQKMRLKDAIHDLTNNLDAADPRARMEAEQTISKWIEESPLNETDAKTIDQAYFDLTRKEIAIRVREIKDFIDRVSPELSDKKNILNSVQTFIDHVSQKVNIDQYENWSTQYQEKLTQLHSEIETYLKLKSIPHNDVKRMTNFMLGDGSLTTDADGVQTAVRSTGVLEDLKYAAFPGQYSTFLNIRKFKNIRQSILRDWSSNYTERVIGYRDEEILKELGRDKDFHTYLASLAARLVDDSDSSMNQLGRFFLAIKDNPKSPMESGSSTVRFLKWLQTQSSDFDHRDEIIRLLEKHRDYFINPNSVKIAVVLHVQSQGIDKDRHPMDRLAAANVFAVDTTTGFTGWVFGTNEDGLPQKRSRLLYINSNYYLGESLVQGKATGDTHIYLAFTDEQGQRRYVLIGQQLGEKAVWTGTKEAADETLRLLEKELSTAPADKKTEIESLIKGVKEAMDLAVKEKQKTMYLPTPQSKRDQFTLTLDETLELAKMGDRSSDMYAIRELLKNLSHSQRAHLNAAIKRSGISTEVKKLFQRFVADPMAMIPAHLNPLENLWFWLFYHAPQSVKDTYIPLLPMVIKDMETSLPSRLGKRSPIMIQSRDFAKENDQDNPRLHKDTRTIIDHKKLEADGFDLKIHPNGFIEGTNSKTGHRIVPLIGDASTSAIATSMVATGRIRNLKHGPQAPLPEHQITLTEKGEKVFFMVADETAPEHLRAMQNSLGVIARRGTKTSHAAIESLGMRIATVVGTQNFIDKLRATDPDRAAWVELLLDTDDVEITVDGNNGFVYLASNPTEALHIKRQKLANDGKFEEAAQLVRLMSLYQNDNNATALPISKLNLEINLDRLPLLRRAVGWIMSNAAEAWRTTKIGLSKIHYSVNLLRAEFSFGYVGIHPRAIVAHEVMTLLDAEKQNGEHRITETEQARLEYLKKQWGLNGSKFWEQLQKDVEVLRQHPDIIKQIDLRIRGFVPTEWNRPSAIAFFKQTHGGNVGSLAAAFPWHKKKVYRFIDFKLREMKELVGGKIFFSDIDETDSMNGFRGTTYLLSPENVSTFVLELEVLADLAKNGIDVDPMFAFVRSPEQLEQCLKITEEVFDREKAKLRSLGMMVEIPINVLEAESFAKLLKAFADKKRIKWFFSYGTNDLSQGLFQFGRDVPALHGISIGKTVSDYTATSPFVERKPDGTYVLRAYDEGRPEVYMSIVHAARVAKKYGGFVALCGEAFNKLSVQNPEQAAAMAAELDAGGASVPNFLNVVRTFAEAELRTGKLSTTEKNNKLKSGVLVSKGQSSIKSGAASRTLIYAQEPGDFLNIYPGDFVVITPHLIADLVSHPEEARNKTILARLNFTGAFIYSLNDQARLQLFLSKMRTPTIALAGADIESLKKHSMGKVTIDFSNGTIYKGEFDVEDQASDTKDLIQAQLDKPIPTVIDTMPSTVFSMNDFLSTTVGTHPKAYRENNPDHAGEDFQDLLFGEFLDVAKTAQSEGKMAIFELDSARVSDFRALKGGADFETEETNPALGVKGILRYLIQAGYDREWLLRTQIRAAIRVHNETKNVGILLTGANIPELSAEANRIFTTIFKKMNYPNKPRFGLKIGAVAQVLNLKAHLTVGEFDFVMTDDQELPLAAQLADARNNYLLQEKHTSSKVVKRLKEEIRHLVLVTLDDVNQTRAKDQQVKLATDGAIHPTAGGHDFSMASYWSRGFSGLLRGFALGLFPQFMVALVFSTYYNSASSLQILALVSVLSGLFQIFAFRSIYKNYRDETIATHLGLGQMGFRRGAEKIQSLLNQGRDAGQLVRIPLGFTSLWIWGSSRFVRNQTPIANSVVLAHELSPWHNIGLLTMAFLPLTFLIYISTILSRLWSSTVSSFDHNRTMKQAAAALVSVTLAIQSQPKANAQIVLRTMFPQAQELNRNISSLLGGKTNTSSAQQNFDFDAQEFAQLVGNELRARSLKSKISASELTKAMLELRKMGIPLQSVDSLSGNKSIAMIINGPLNQKAIEATVQRATNRSVFIMVPSFQITEVKSLLNQMTSTNRSNVFVIPQTENLITNGIVALSEIKNNLPKGYVFNPAELIVMLSEGLTWDISGLSDSDARSLAIFILGQSIFGQAMHAIDLDAMTRVARMAMEAA